MIKILFITHYSDCYGANRSLLDLIDSIQEIKSSTYIEVITPTNGPLITELKTRGINFVIVPFRLLVEYRWKSKTIAGGLYWDFISSIKGIIRLGINMYYARIIVKRIKQNRIGVVHFNSTVALFSPELFRVKAYFVTHVRELIESQYGLKCMLGWNYYYHLVGKSNLVIYISHFVESMFSHKIDSDKSQIIYDYIKIKESEKQLDKRGPDIVFGIFGLIHPIKGQMEALEAFDLFSQKHPNSRLFIVGGGDRTQLEKYLNRNPQLKNRVHFTGFVSNVSNYYHKVDICLICSTNEALGRVTVEAMQQKCAVVGKHSGATMELIDDNQNGLLYQDDARDLAKKMERLAINRELRNYIVNNAFKSVSAKFSKTNTTQKYIDHIINQPRVDTQ